MKTIIIRNTISIRAYRGMKKKRKSQNNTPRHFYRPIMLRCYIIIITHPLTKSCCRRENG